MRKYTEAQIDEACRLREEGLTYPEIGRRTGMNPRTIFDYCQQRGAIPPRVKNFHASPTWTAELDEEVVRLRSGGMRIVDIARAIGRPEWSVDRRLKALAFNEAKREALEGAA